MGKRQYHIGLSESDGAKYAILPGDPGRVPTIASMLEEAECIAENREFLTYGGYLSGAKVLVTSTGIGGPSAAIALEELCQVGVKTAIRVGTCGGMQPDVRGGDLVIASGAVRMEGTSREYAPIEYPAVADFGIVQALSLEAEGYKLAYHTGVVQSKDSFYGQHSPESMPVEDELQRKWSAWVRCGCLASEMECASLFTIGAVRRMRLGAVLQVLWNQELEKAGENGVVKTDAAVSVAVGALKKLIEQDKS